MYNKILEETGKQFLKRYFQGIAVEVSANLIVEGIKTAFELYKQRKFMDMNVEYADAMQQFAMQQEGSEYEEDSEQEEYYEPAPPKPKRGRKPKKKA